MNDRLHTLRDAIPDLPLIHLKEGERVYSELDQSQRKRLGYFRGVVKRGSKWRQLDSIYFRVQELQHDSERWKQLAGSGVDWKVHLAKVAGVGRAKENGSYDASAVDGWFKTGRVEESHIKTLLTSPEFQGCRVNDIGLLIGAFRFLVPWMKYHILEKEHNPTTWYRLGREEYEYLKYGHRIEAFTGCWYDVFSRIPRTFPGLLEYYPKDDVDWFVKDVIGRYREAYVLMIYVLRKRGLREKDVPVF